VTLDDAITHADEKFIQHADTPGCGAEHEQLAKWLRELRAFKAEAAKQVLWRKLNAHADLPQTIRSWQDAVDEYAHSKGWRTGEQNIGDLLLMITTEVAEAFEEHREGHDPTETYYKPETHTGWGGSSWPATPPTPEKPTKPEGIPSEMADIVIRVLDFCGWAGIDLQAIMAEKHTYNLTRPYRHGGKRV
jgi:NTP pyrophosphatase (non-canonical NTP hydrolase)